MKHIVSVLIAASLLALMFVPAGAQGCAVQYTVKPGDNLYRIGLAHGVPWPIIAQVNNLANPNLIFAGQVLCIPAVGTAAPTSTGPTPTGPTPTASATPTATATKVATPITGTATAVATLAPTATAAPTSTGFVIPTFTIIGVVRDQSITIRTANFPANQTFTVLMGPIGTQGVGGTASGTVDSGAGGTFTATLTIPAAMAGANQIAVRLQSPQGYYSYNWFYNFTYSVP